MRLKTRFIFTQGTPGGTTPRLRAKKSTATAGAEETGGPAEAGDGDADKENHPRGARVGL